MDRDDSSTSTADEPILPPDSPGSSVSTQLQDEYDELLRCAVLMPQYERPESPPQLIEQNTNNDNAIKSSRIEREKLHNSLAMDLEMLNRQVQESQQFRLGAAVTNPKVEGKKNEDNMHPDGLFDAHIIQNSSFNAPKKTDVQEIVVRQQENADTSLESNPGSSPRPVLNSTLKSGQTGADYGNTSEFSVSGIDPDLAQIDHMMDKWTLDLKRSVLAEFSQTKIKCLEQNRQQLLKQAERHAVKESTLLQELEAYKELLHTHQQTVDRKNQIITNLTDAVCKQRDKFDVLRAFTDWKIEMLDARREAFTSKLADRHHILTLKRKVWIAWRSILENKWRQRVERACQKKAQDVCMALTDDYEAKIAELNAALRRSQQEVSHLNTERENFEENMKKAFMRGVCALNMEAMTMFGDQEAGGGASGASGEVASHPPAAGKEQAQAVAHPTPTVITNKAFTVGQNRKPSARGKGAIGKVTAKIDISRAAKGPTSASHPTVLHPPISSVVVERHPAVITSHQPPQLSGQSQTARHGQASHTSSTSRPARQQRPGQTLTHTVKVVE